ncbi:MAG: hypothetical protein ACI959_000929, partial [Limisphaerales bacterium]
MSKESKYVLDNDEHLNRSYISLATLLLGLFYRPKWSFKNLMEQESIAISSTLMFISAIIISSILFGYKL